MAKSEVIKVQEGDKVTELSGKALEAFLSDRAETQLANEARLKIEAEAKALKISAYTKLGLTTEEINAIL
jgi:hypothetical protein